MKIKSEGRYNVDGLDEGEYEPDSSDAVFKNIGHIKDKVEMDLLETALLEKALNKLIDSCSQSQKFTVHDICEMHKLWLGSVYSWAGQYRQVNMNKSGFQFAAAHLIPKLMGDFEKKYLKKFTPCRFEAINNIAEALAIVHVEFIIIHPFREGNARIARVLSTLMALQANLPELSFTDIQEGKKYDYYIKAIHAGYGRDYKPMYKSV